MCGIIGVFNSKSAEKIVDKGLDILKNRGKDGKARVKAGRGVLGHALHAIVNHVKQPIEFMGSYISANCEIYNWKELSEKYKIDAKNDAELMIRLLDKLGVEKAVKEFDGPYAFAYLNDDKIYLARDIIGVKPLWYCHNDGFLFASEKKALELQGFFDINELNPRHILVYDIKADKIDMVERGFYSLGKEHKIPKKEMINQVSGLLANAIGKRVPDKKIGLLFSGGVDSCTIALILKQLGVDFTCYTTSIVGGNLKEAEDLVYAKKAAELMGLKLKIAEIKIEDVPKYLKKIVPLIEDNNVVKVGVALTLFAACESAKKDDAKIVFSGLGSEEIFAGYERHKNARQINKECISGLLMMYERDLYRDDVLSMYNSVELRVPFLDRELVEYALKIPGKFKITKENNKMILREAALLLGLDKEFALRPKKAAQYGSNVDKAISKLGREEGFKYKSEYLKQFYPSHNLRLGALISSGKDSMYALHVMDRQNYEISCLMSVKSKNPYSYMFHTPAIDIVDLQSESLGIPLVSVDTEGEKEQELKDLTRLLEEAKKKYKIEGVITGALFSDYQRSRIEKVCDSLSLKIFSPLWHLNQETEMRELMREGFEIWFSSVAAHGLDKDWLGRKIGSGDVDKLVKMNDDFGMNVAGEGGEYESLVLDCPLFQKIIKIETFDIEEESENNARLIVNKAKLVKK